MWQGRVDPTPSGRGGGSPPCGKNMEGDPPPRGKAGEVIYLVPSGDPPCSKGGESPTLGGKKGCPPSCGQGGEPRPFAAKGVPLPPCGWVGG